MKLSKELLGRLADWLDDLIKAKGIVETLDGFLIKQALNLINNQWVVKLPEETVGVIEQVLTAILDMDYDLAAESLGELLAELIDTPLIDGTEEEVEVYQKTLQLIADLILGLLKK